LLQVLDEGRLTDRRGRHVDFTQTIVAMTSNLGAEAFAGGRGRSLGFAVSGEATASDDRAERALESARGQLPPELWGRIDERCAFAPLSRAEVAAIARLLIEDSARRLAAERRVRFTVDDAAVELLLESGGYDPALGARPMRQTVQRLVEAPLAEAILRGEVPEGAVVEGKRVEGRIEFVLR
jgi:ATP-dependent Clp protease ATP-binding subunit ClpC